MFLGVFMKETQQPKLFAITETSQWEKLHQFNFFLLCSCQAHARLHQMYPTGCICVPSYHISMPRTGLCWISRRENIHGNPHMMAWMALVFLAFFCIVFRIKTSLGVRKGIWGHTASSAQLQSQGLSHAATSPGPTFHAQLGGMATQNGTAGIE